MKARSYRVLAGRPAKKECIAVEQLIKHQQFDIPRRPTYSRVRDHLGRMFEKHRTNSTASFR